MGQGQSDIALRLLRDCASNGDWLCLKNLHLMIHWLSVLEKVRLKELWVGQCILSTYSYFVLVRLNKHAVKASIHC